MRITLILTWFLITAGALLGGPAHIERVPLADGAELLTLFGTSEEGDIPLMSILRDTLGDPANERLRNVWVLTYVRPTVVQRITAAIPFWYLKAGGRSIRVDGPPSPILDLAAPQRGTWTGLIETAVQSQVLDGSGVLWRAPSRGYRSNAGEYRAMRVAEALRLLESVGDQTPGSEALTPDEWDEVQARLSLSRRLLGGLVSQSSLQKLVEREDRLTQMNRGHNWELLRQQAEKDGLYFESFPVGDPSPSYAVLWIDKDELRASEKHPFDGAFLKISNPWSDPGLKTWKGYERNGRIPLGLYSISYPPAPILMVDFRDSGKPKRREMFLRAIDYAGSGLLGLSGYGNWSYLAARTSWNWVRHRHGAVVDRLTRVSAYAELRHALLFDDQLDPNFRAEVAKRVDHLALNPFERGLEAQGSIARRQYAALLEYARRPEGLAKALDEARGREMVPIVHGRVARGFLTAASASTLGLYKHREPTTPELVARLERQRRLDANLRYFRRVLGVGARNEVAWDLDEVNRRLAEVNALGLSAKELEGGTGELLLRVRAGMAASMQTSSAAGSQ